MFTDYKVGDTAFKDYPCVTLLYVITIVFAESENSVSCEKSIISFCFEHGWVWVSDFHKVNRKPFLLDFCKAFPILTIIKGELAYISQIVPIYLIVGDGLWEITFVGWYFIWNSTERCDWLRKSLLDT